MTFTNQTNRKSATGSGLTEQEVAFLFPISATSDVTVYKRVTATGVQTDLDETTNYTISIDGDSGGTLTTVTAIETTEQIHIVRNTPYTQTLDLEAGGTFNAENIEDAIDKNTKLSIQEKDKSDRTPRFPETDPTSSIGNLPSSIDRVSKTAGYDSDGKPNASVEVASGSVSFTTIGTNIAEAADVSAVVALLNLEIGTDVQAQDAQLDDIAALAIADSNIIVGDGSNWVAESGATARTSLGAAADADVTKKDGSVAYTGTGVGFKDEDNMTSNSATATASQQSVKAYVDNQKQVCRMYRNGNVTPATAYQKVELNAESYDPDNIGASYKITPTIAGYYQVNGLIQWTSDTDSGSEYGSALYKNGVAVTVNLGECSGAGDKVSQPASDVIYCNGSTDYLELYAYSASSATYAGGASKTFLSVALVAAD